MGTWTEREQERAFELTQPVLCGGRHGTAFPISASASAYWYVTCAHVLGESPKPGDVIVGGIGAAKVCNGGPQGLDLALVCLARDPREPDPRLPRPGVEAELGLLPLMTPPNACRVPGCHRPTELESKRLLRDWIDGRLSGERTDVFSADGGLAMKGWRLDVADDRLLEQGYSGAPVIDADTGRVFAVAVMRTGSGKGGIAICVSNLVRILPEALAGLLPSSEQSGLAEAVRALFSDLSDRLDAAAIRDLVSRAAPDDAPLTWPASESAAAYCDWLLDRLPFSNARHPLYFVLDWLEGRAKGDEVIIRRIRQAQQRLLAVHPGLDTGPLPAPRPKALTEPVLIEVIFERLPNPSFKGFAVHSYFHAADGSGYEAGPQREPDSGGRGRLDIHDAGEITGFVQELTAQRMALGLDLQACIFQFRVPVELMLQPFDAWPKNRVKQPLGGEYPVVLGAAERDWDGCESHWADMQTAMDRPVRERLGCCPPEEPMRLEGPALDAFLARLRQTPCIALDRVPEIADPDAITHLAVLAEVGVAGLWPCTQEAEQNLCESLKACLGGLPLAQLPFALRDLRGQRAEALPADCPEPMLDRLQLRRVTLFWDNPHRSAKRPGAKRFAPGFGPGFG